MFLKTIIENVIRIETKIKTVQQEMENIQIKTNNDKLTIDKLNHKIELIEKHNTEMQKELNNNRQLTNNHPRTYAQTETGQYTIPQKPQEQPTRTRTYLPPKVLSPGIGDQADPGQEPELTWAKVTTRRYKPKVNIPADIADNITDECPEYKDDNNDDTRDKQNYTDRENEILEQQMDKSAKIIGLKPILKKYIITEKNRMKNDDDIPRKMTEGDIYATATKNVVFKFLKNNFKMSEYHRYNLKIMNIFPNRDDDHDTLYIKCQDQSDISTITSYAKNLSDDSRQQNSTHRPTLVPHVPTIIYKIYQECEKLLWQIRTKSEGRYTTKLWMGKRDIQLRFKEKGDTTQWKYVPLLKIPDNIPKPEFKAHKSTQPTEKPDNNLLNNTNNHPRPDHQTTKPTQTPTNTRDNNKQQPTEEDLTGTISNQLADNNQPTKRKISPQNNSPKKIKTTIIPDKNLEISNKWELIQNMEDEDGQPQMETRPNDSNQMDDHHSQLISQYQQITVSSKSNIDLQNVGQNQDTFTITPIVNQGQNGPHYG